jgi:dienelactone hydrolase
MSPVVVAAMMAAVSLAAEAGQSTDYVVGEKTFEGYRARAQGNSKGLVVIIHDWSGLDDYEKRRADMLSALGYDAFAIDLYGKGNRPDTLEARRREAGQLGQNRALMRRLLLGGLAEGQKMGDAKAVVMGYCFGGGAALELARSGEAKGVAGYATFHGALKTPEGQSYPKTTPPILIMHRGADTSVTMDDVVALQRELEQAGVTYEIEIYSGAPHGFTAFDTDRYHKRADELSWSAFSDFLGATLGE